MTVKAKNVLENKDGDVAELIILRSVWGKVNQTYII